MDTKRNQKFKYHILAHIILWNYCILAAILDIRWRTKWWLLPFFRNTHKSFTLWKIFKIALKFSVSTFLSNCSQTEPPLFPDESHIGPTRMRFCLNILYSLLMKYSDQSNDQAVSCFGKKICIYISDDQSRNFIPRYGDQYCRINYMYIVQMV